MYTIFHIVLLNYFTGMNFHHVKTENKIHTYKSLYIKIYLYFLLWPKIALTRNRHKDGMTLDEFYEEICDSLTAVHYEI